MFAQFLSRIAHDRRGSVAQIFALALIPVAFMAGAAIDYTRSVAERSELQVAVDAAVLAGAKDASQTWTTTSANVFKSAYVGTASASVPTTFVGIAGIQQIPIGVSGKAAGGNQADTSCILSLGTGQPVSDQSLTFNGAPNVALSGCSIRSNTSLKCNGHGTGALASIAAGTATGCSNPQSGAAVVPDIYAELAINITKQCSAWPGATWVPGTVPASPQVVTLMKPTHTEYHVCGDLTLSGSGDLTGGGADTVIVIENGRLILDGNASIQTSRVAFVLTGDNTKPSEIEFPNGNGHAASLTLSPPTGVNNPWRGVSVYQDPALTFQVDADWGPGATLNAEGLVYLPKADLKIHGTPSSNNPICTKVVLNSFTSSGSVNLNQTAQGCENLGVKQWKGPGARITG